MVDFRIGNGFDVHPWSQDTDRKLVLGGVTLDGEQGLVGHSDADVIAHACIDALLGAACLGDIGTMFPDTDNKYLLANSLDLLTQAVGACSDAGWTVVNIDCTVILDKPKILPVRDLMQSNISEIVGAPVSVKGKRSEGVSGLNEGVRCYTVALISA